jgi:putative ABC transport system permease protein
MATVAGVTILAIGSASDSAQSERDYLPQAPMGAASISVFDADDAGWAEIEELVRGLLPGRDIVPVRSVRWTEDDMTGLAVRAVGCAGPVLECAWYPGGPGLMTIVGDIVVLDRDALVAVTPPEVRDAAQAAYRPDRALVFGDGAVDDTGSVTLQGTRWDGEAEQLLGEVVLPATEVLPPSSGTVLRAPATVVVPPELADRLPVEMATSKLLVGGPDAPVTAAEQERLEEAVTALSAESYVYVERGWSDDLEVARLVLFGVGGLLVLIATLTATGLAVADARPDHATLAAVGAAPRTRRFMAMGSAAVIGVFGAALGVLAGLAPGIAVAHPLTTEIYGSGMGAVVVIPWDLLAAVAVGVPLLAVLVTGLVVRSRLPMATRIAG